LGVFAGLALLARVASRWGFSAIPLYLLDGLAFGNGGPAPLNLSKSFSGLGAEIGVLLLLFMLGLEYTGDELKENLRKGFRASLADLALNFPPGLIAGLLLGWKPLAAILLGGVTYISSSGVIAKLLTELRRLECLGAFLVGIAGSGPMAAQTHRLLAPLRDLFAAAFFFFFGLQIDRATLPRALPLALGLGVVTALTKTLTGYWAARQAGADPRGCLRAGMAVVARGESSIVIAGLGAGLEPRLGPLSAAYVLFLAVLGPILARAVDCELGPSWAGSQPVPYFQGPKGHQGFASGVWEDR
jgi:Kef-type K+ transport system membrane component KefB